MAISNPHETSSSSAKVGSEFRCPHCRCHVARSFGACCSECGVYFDAGTLVQRRQLRIAGACWAPASARLALVLAAVSLLPFSWLSTASIQQGNPIRWSPIPLVFMIPAWIHPVLGIIVNGGFVLGSFALFSWPLMDGRPRVLRWSLGTVTVMQILNWIFLAQVYTEGMQLNESHTTAVCGINAFLTIAIYATAVGCWIRPSFLLAISLQWLAWFWFAMYSFPLLVDLVGGV